MSAALYSHSTDFALDAFVKAFDSAMTNFEAAAALRERGLHGPATSLAVLSLEEVGKMILLDGLLFAREADDRHKAYTKGHLSHRSKLGALEIFPLFFHYLTTMDSRRSESAFKQTIVVSLSDLKQKRQRLAERFDDGFRLADLDALKQRGFYSHQFSTRSLSNQEGIPPETAHAVVDLAWRVTGGLRFVLSHSLEAYKTSFTSLRSNMDPRTLLKIRERAKKIVQDVFDGT